MRDLNMAVTLAADLLSIDHKVVEQFEHDW